MYHSSCAWQLPAGDQDRQFLEVRRQRGAVAQQFAELLPLVGQFGAMQHGAQRPAQFAARAGDDGVMHALLLGRHRVGGEERNARHVMLLHFDFVMPGLVPGIARLSLVTVASKSWMAGTSPAMTPPRGDNALVPFPCDAAR